MQIKLTFTLPAPLKSQGYRMGRKFLALALGGDDSGFAGWLLGQPNGLSPIRIRYAGHAHPAIVIVCCGSEDCLRLTQHAEEIRAALEKQAGGEVRMLFGGGSCSAAQDQKLHYYRINRMVWQSGRKNRWNGELRILEGEELEAYIKSRIYEGLLRQAQTFNYPLDESGDIYRVAVGPRSPVKIKREETDRMWASAEVFFATNLNLVGEWHVGKLCGRDYGRIIRLFQKPEQIK